MFQYINWLTYEKRTWESLTDAERKSFSIYMTNRLLATDMRFVILVSQVQFWNLTPEQCYNFYLNILPKQKLFLQYTFPQNKKASKQLVEFLSSKWWESSKVTRSRISSMSQDELFSELVKYGLNDDQIDELCQLKRKPKKTK